MDPLIASSQRRQNADGVPTHSRGLPVQRGSVLGTKLEARRNRLAACGPRAAVAFHLFLLAPALANAQAIIRAERQAPAAEEAKADAAKPTPTSAEPLTEEERIAAAIAESLANSEDAVFLARRRDMDIITGDLRRTLNLPADKQRKLEVAAKGAVDRSLDNWRPSQEQHVRQQAQGFSVAAVLQRLANAGDVQTGNSAPSDQPLWVQTLATTLTPQEQQSWANAETQRRAYRNEAIAAVLITELERRLGLTAAQADKIAPLAQRTLADYLPDMAAYIDRSGGLDFRMLLLIISGMPPTEVNAIITPAQMERWRQVTADYAGWWQGVEQQHFARLGRRP